MSGAGRIKGDGSTDDELIEVKDARKEYRLKEADLRKHWKEAVQVRKEPVFVIEYESGLQVEVRVIKP